MKGSYYFMSYQRRQTLNHNLIVRQYRKYYQLTFCDFDYFNWIKENQKKFSFEELDVLHRPILGHLVYHYKRFTQIKISKIKNKAELTLLVVQHQLKDLSDE